MSLLDLIAAPVIPVYIFSCCFTPLNKSKLKPFSLKKNYSSFS